jgi:hypothetical protein
LAHHRAADAQDHDVGLALREGLATGLREHLPGAVGLIAHGIPLCGLMAFAHFVLGATWIPSAFFGGAGIGLADLTRRVKR